ncbi:sialidase family protein [Nitrosospira lacus]|uniref:sialidase family protein n=1 Tax=Nitrosospira lacus TaxID=1288494 RepID=UPI00125FC42E|nr:sialidase family protein [Nitrosospira lacus]
MTYSLHVTAALIGLTMAAVSSEAAQPPVARIHVIENPAAAGAQFPRLASLPDGGILMSWVEPADKDHVLKYGLLRDGKWIRQGEAARGGDWFINWSDFPSVVAIDKSFWVAHWLVKRKGGRTYDYDIATSISNDSGITWSTPKSPHRDGLAAEHGFAVIFPVHGDAGIIWLDGRDRLVKQDGGKHKGKSGNFALRYTRIHRDGGMDKEQVIDDSTCTCCWPAVAVTPAGPVAAWRGRTDNEIRDHRVARLHHGKWTKPVPLHGDGWEIAGCPVNGPMLAARGMQVVAVWFTAANDHPRIRAAFSTDGGQSFGQPVDVDKADPSGRVGVAWSDDRTAVVSWITAADTSSRKAGLAVRKLYANGTAGPIQYLRDISGGRDTGVPQLAAYGQDFIMAWTGEAPGQGIKTIFVPDSLMGSARSIPPRR